MDLGPETTSSGNNGLIAIAGIGGLPVLSIIVGAVIVLRGDEDDEFDFEDEDDIVLERDVNTTPSQRPSARPKATKPEAEPRTRGHRGGRPGPSEPLR